MVTQTLPAQQGGFATLLDRVGRASDSLDSFKESVWARFASAPDYILRKLRHTAGTWNEETARDGNLEWCGMCALSGEDMEEYVRRRRVAERRFATLCARSERLRLETLRQSCFHREVEVVVGDGPTVENWSYSDDHPGSYSDEAWTSSREIAPGVWLEKRHACLGTTRAWVILSAGVCQNLMALA